MEKEFVTKKGYDKLKSELENLKNVERPKTLKELQIAKSHGDLRENAEYHAAKERLAFIDARINELSEYLSKVEVVDPSTFSHEKVMFGSTVVLLDLDTDKEVSYTIVGAFESDPNRGLISIKTPLAKALLGKKEGDEVIVNLPGGEKEFEVVKVFFKEW